jgi:hypothetical protein
MCPARFVLHSVRFLSIALIAIAGIASPRAEILDQAKIHYDYSNGEFGQVEKDLAAFRARNKTYSREDSIFIAKHLAVVYAANPRTREKGRYYMFRLLELMPGAKIVDMFVSEEIERIFEKVREEFNVKAAAMGKAPYRSLPSGEAAPVPGSAADPAGKASRKKGRSSTAKYWVAGGVGLIAVGAAAYFLIPRDEAGEDKVYVVDKRN